MNDDSNDHNDNNDQVIAAEGEHKASRALRQAAEVIVDSPAALQVCTLIECNATKGTRKRWHPRKFT